MLTKPCFRILTKIKLHNLCKASAEKSEQIAASNLALTSTSKSWPNLASESRPRFNLDSTFYKTSAEKNWPSSSFKSCLNFNFKILTKPCAQSLNKRLAFWPNLSFQICNKLLPTRSSSATVTTSTSWSWHLHMPGSHQWSLLNRSQWVSEWVS